MAKKKTAVLKVKSIAVSVADIKCGFGADAFFVSNLAEHVAFDLDEGDHDFVVFEPVRVVRVSTPPTPAPTVSPVDVPFTLVD